MAKKDKKTDNIIELKTRLKDARLDKLYVFYGDEEYRKEDFIRQIENLVPDAGLEEFNRIYLNGAADYETYDSILEGMPMMTDKRLVIFRDTNIFTTRKSGDIVPPDDSQKEFWKNKFKNLSDDTVLLFCEKNVDTRSAVFKAADKAGFAVKFDFLPVEDLKSWVIKRTLKNGKKIDDKTSEYLISVIDPGLANLEHEHDKLLAYCDDIIYKTDVDKVVSKSVSVQIFDITDGITQGNADKVFKIINSLRTQKESAFGILYLIYSNAEKMLKLRANRISNKNDAAKLLNTTSWLADKYLRGASAFDTETLFYMVTRVPEIDFEIKSGRIAEWQALELYIFNALNAIGKFKKGFNGHNYGQGYF